MSTSLPVSSPPPRKRRSQMLKEINNTYPSTAAPVPVKPPKPFIPYCPRDLCAPVSEPKVKKSGRSAWQSLKKGKICIIGDSLGFEGNSISIVWYIQHANFAKGLETPFLLGTMLTPAGLLSAFEDPEMFYHAYAVSRKLKDSDL